MTADLSAARKDAEELIEDYGGHIGAVIADLLAALDQAAEALKPLAELTVSGRSPLSPELAEKYPRFTEILRRCATVYATLKPEDGKGGADV